MTKTLDMLGLGEALVEFNQVNPGQPVYRRGHGGDTSNAMIAAARQGARAGYWTALGKDEFGDELMALWAQEGVDAGRVPRHPEAPTGIYFVSHGAAGHVFTYRRKGSAASLMRPEDLPADLLAATRALHVSAISQAISPNAAETVEAAMTAARGAGALVAYDTNLRLRLWDIETARATIHRALRLADIVLPSLEEAQQLTGLTAPDAICDFYLGLGPRLVALKLGAEGALIADGERRSRIAPHVVTAVDATGAGDAFDGSFVWRLLSGDEPNRAGRYAATAAALSTTGFGAVAPIPTRAQVEAAMGERR
ncbi:MAG: sugar kinase [Alphaproteobacteria bacterium]|nr:sugar kinase [Alphaproteobacteria bacterium]